MTLGVVMLLWDLLRIGVGEARPIRVVGPAAADSAESADASPPDDLVRQWP